MGESEFQLRRPQAPAGRNKNTEYRKRRQAASKRAYELHVLKPSGAVRAWTTPDRAL